MTSSIPGNHRALVLRSTTVDPKVETVPVPTIQAGTAILRILATPVLSYAKDVYLNGNPRQYTFPLPMVPGTGAIARVAAVSSDATSLKVGQLVLFDCFIRARDDPTNTVRFLSALHDGFSPASKELMANGGFRDGSYAEYMKAPVENCYLLDEAKLMGDPIQGGLGYQTEQLCEIAKLLIPFGGLNDVGVKPGETVLISPATGSFGGCACMIALAMGARVIAWGRDESKLANLKSVLEKTRNGRGRIVTAPLKNDPEVDLKTLQSFGQIDVYFDISPASAQSSTHIKTAILSLRAGGRVSMMGGLMEDVAIPHSKLMHFDITLKGKFMYNPQDVLALIRMAELGCIGLGESDGCQVVGKFGLDQWKEAFELASVRCNLGERVVLVP